MKATLTNNGTQVLVSVRGKRRPTRQRMDAAARRILPGARLASQGETPNHLTRIYRTS